MNLTHQNILVGVSGGIAAYKAAELVRLLRKQHAEVRVVLTDSGAEFVTPLTFQALSGHPVHQHLLDSQAEAAMGHIELAKWADAIVIAPASANCLAKLAHGLADDLLSTLCLASDAELYLAPAMNQQMWAHPATQRNLSQLRNQGAVILEPDNGEQACGDTGPGRMQEPSNIVQQLLSTPAPTLDLSQHRLLITAGPTREAIDPVRFLSNRSSGKMGYAIAKAAENAGATVQLISGPVALTPPSGVTVHPVTTAAQMHQLTLQLIDEQTLFIGCAAVADYRPQTPHSQKIKKNQEQMQLTLVKNPDIIQAVAARKIPGLCTVGFAAETEHLIEHARAKRRDKQLDLICANDVSQGGFDEAVNALTIIGDNQQHQLARTSKASLARQLLAIVSDYYDQKYLSNHPSQNT